MDRSTTAEHLAQAERHVVQGQAHIDRQHELIAEMERRGHDTWQAKRLLDTFVDLQSTHVADRDRLREELTKADAQRC